MSYEFEMNITVINLDEMILRDYGIFNLVILILKIQCFTFLDYCNFESECY